MPGRPAILSRGAVCSGAAGGGFVTTRPRDGEVDRSGGDELGIATATTFARLLSDEDPDVFVLLLLARSRDQLFMVGEVVVTQRDAEDEEATEGVTSTLSTGSVSVQTSAVRPEESSVRKTFLSRPPETKLLRLSVTGAKVHTASSWKSKVVTHRC
jgi:hypothetical protein